MCVHLDPSMMYTMCAGAQGGQNRVLYTLKLQLQPIVSCPRECWMPNQDLGHEIQVLRRAASVLSH